MPSGMRKVLSLVVLAVGCGLLGASELGSANQAPAPDTFRWSLTVDIDYVDPALAYYGPTWTLMYATGALLYNYPDAPAPRGSRLVPEVASGFPQVSRDGRTYTIRLKKTYRFSSGRRVTALSFAWAINRALQRRMSSPAQAFIEDIVGAEDVIKGRSRLASGVLVPDRYTLRIRTKARRSDLLARLAMPFFAAIPEDLPVNPEGIRPPVVSAGPYFIREWTRNRRLILARNRFYRGPRPHRVRRIDVDIALPLEAIKLNIDRGATDAGDLPPSAHADLGRSYGVKRRSPGRYFANPAPSILYIAFNHDRPLFGGPSPLGNVRLKQAINYAIDRTSLVRQLGPFGGIATDQLIPPTLPGYRNAGIYPPRPDLARARALANGHTRSGEGKLWCSNRAPIPQICGILQGSLRQIGLNLDILFEPRACGIFCWNPGKRGEPFDLYLAQFRADFPDPSMFLELLDGTTLGPWNNTNYSYFDDAAFNRKLARAHVQRGLERFRAYSRLERDILRTAAPVAVIGVRNDRHYVSARVGCYHHHPVYGWDFPAICLRR
jgi:oligopeptide transport system substrate-binding protein